MFQITDQGGDRAPGEPGTICRPSPVPTAREDAVGDTVAAHVR
jgi:hypothetical protein